MIGDVIWGTRPRQMTADGIKSVEAGTCGWRDSLIKRPKE